MRAELVLACADGMENRAVAARLRVTPQTVSKWRNRFAGQRLDELLDARRSGAPRTIDDPNVEAVIARTLETVPETATHWSSRSVGPQNGPVADGGQAHLARLRLAAPPSTDL
ncbi:helix-turn-helix domain-containing protein [Thauera butanivorans]|uniref:helix-turn-helix domain-containing protein n=1 Tax=Thauera butanivorans TaxID=86174 RepID=UPI000838048F|nr:helix-turn-helix domain-containing protein [Thauera butanivorans]